MPITFRDATANRLMTELYYQDGGTRRTIIGAWYQDGGTRREVFSLPRVQLGNRTLEAELSGVGTATATYNLNSGGDADGSVTPGGTGGGSYSPDWRLTGASADYESRMTVVSGSFSTGTVGTWQGLGTTRSWTRSRTTVGVSTVEGTLEIRDAITLAVLVTATISLLAERL